MRYASKVSEVINAFSQDPLRIDQMEEFYCGNTMEYRTGDKYSSPIEDIFEACQEAGDNHAFLLLGHRGCGKSTELNRLSDRLAAKGFQVKTITCSMDLDLFNIVYSDLFILMGEALVQIAEESRCRIEKDTLREIMEFWGEGTEILTVQELESASLESGLSAETPGLLKNILNLFAKIKADLKYNEETRKEYRRKISVCSSEWIRLLSLVSEKITEKNEGNHPVIIFEDLDKLNPEDAWKVFYNYAAVLSGMSFPVIYTFPISLSYDTRFSAMESYFITKTLPMIKIQTIEGTLFQEGINVIREI